MTCTEERFLAEVAGHRMRVLRDDELYRHLRFQQPETNNRWFELVTWSGCLCINGDMGNYLFSRTPDMFWFFRSPAGTLRINRPYWAEKLRAQDCHGKHCDGVKRWSSRQFEQAIKERYDEYVELHMPENAPERAELWRNIQTDVLCHSEDERAAMDAAYYFDEHGLRFEDFSEVDCNEWGFHFVWCLYAIVWGIQQYDTAKSAQTAAAA